MTSGKIIFSQYQDDDNDDDDNSIIVYEGAVTTIKGSKTKTTQQRHKNGNRQDI